MTTSTPRTDRHRTAGPSSPAGFTLVEILIAASLSTLVLAGVMSAFLFIGRTGFSASNYSEMEAQTRRALDRFAHDVRQASGIHWNHSQSITLSLPTATNATTRVTYAYDSSSIGPTARSLYRLPGDAGSSLPREVLVRQLAPDFSFQRFKLDQNGTTANAAANDLETKLVQMNLRLVRTGRTTVDSTQSAISARHVLRNKRVSN